jgi:hypothetical protein
LYWLGNFAHAFPAAPAAPDEVRHEPAVNAPVPGSGLSRAGQARSLAALILDDVIGNSVGHVEQSARLAPVNPAANLDLAAVRSLRNDLHETPLTQ